MTCSDGNSFGWPKNSRNPALFVNTDPSLTLKKIKDNNFIFFTCQSFDQWSLRGPCQFQDWWSWYHCSEGLQPLSASRSQVGWTSILWGCLVGWRHSRRQSRWSLGWRSQNSWHSCLATCVMCISCKVWTNCTYILLLVVMAHHLHCLNKWDEADKVEDEEG